MEKLDRIKTTFCFLESLKDAVFTIDERSVVTSWNKAASELYSVPADEAIGKHLQDILPMENSDVMLKGMKEEVFSKGLWRGKVLHKSDKSGKFRVDWNATSCIPDDSEIQIMVSAQKEIPQKVEVNTIKPQPNIWESIISSMPGLVLILDEHLTITYINKDTKKHWDSLVVGYQILDFIEVKYKEQVAEILKAVQQGKTVSNVVVPVRRKNGEEVWYDCNLVRTYPEGESNDITIMATDITLQKQAEYELIKSETLFRSIFEGSAHGMIATDLEGKIIKTNESLGYMLGYSDNELMDKNILDITAEDDVSDSKRYISELIGYGQRFVQFEQRLVAKDGNYVWAENTVSLVEDEVSEYRFLVSLVKDITRYKEAENARLNLEEKYHELFETIKDGVVIYSAVDDGRDFVIKGFNRAAEKIENASRKQVIGKKVTEIFPGVKEFGLLDIFRQVYKTGETIKYPVKEYKDSRIIGWRENIVYRLSNHQIVAVYYDITEQKQYESQLIENEEVFRAVFETAIDSIFIKDKERKYLRVNPAMLDLYSITRKQIIGKTDEDLFPVELAKQERDDDLRVLDGEILVAEKTRYLANKLHSFHTVKVPVRDVEGNIIGLCGIARDTTDRIKNENELQDQKEKFRSLTENSTDYIIRFDDKARHVYVNPAAEKSYGNNVNVLGKTHREVGVDEHLCQLWEESIGKVFDSGEILEEIVEFEYQDDKKWLDWRLVPEYDINGHIATVLAVSRDITPLKYAEKEKELLEEQLRQSQKMEAIGQLAGGVAHDFNNLLTTISGNVSLAKMEIDKEDSINEMLDEISLASDRAADLTRQLLAFSRKQIIEPKILDLNSMITGLHKMLVRIIGEDVRLDTKPSTNLGNIKADPGQIEQIIINLAVNARDAMPDGGKLVIETANVDLDDKYGINHPYAIVGNYVMLAVSDTGHGMDSDTVKHIFDPFFTTKAQGKGTGLGLSTVYGIVKQHGGSIEVYSEKGTGTTFKIYFPEVNERADNISLTGKQQKIPTGNETILIVEDEHVVRVMASKILHRLGYNVLTASTGKEALDIFYDRDGNIDLLLTDVIMPNMNGWDLAETILRLSPDLKVLFTSGYTDNVIAHHGVLDEGVNFIGKPYSPVAIAQKIRNVLDGKDN